MVLSIFMGVSTILGAVNIEFDQNVFNLTNQVNTDSLLSTISRLSGEEPVTIGGIPDSIPCRLAITDGAHKAALWISEQLEAHGIEAEVQEFESDLGSVKSPLPIGTDREDLESLFSEAFLSEMPYTMWNVVGTLPGEDEYEVLITAHYDAISEDWFVYTPGADDNASGVAGVIETARILSEQDLKHTVKFVLFGGEELGLHGSDYYVDQLQETGEEDLVLGVLNLDMIAYDGGGVPEIDIHCHPWDKVSAEQGQMLADIIDVYGFDLVPEMFTKESSDRSDHASFWPRLIPAMLLIEDFEDFNPFYHTTDDRIYHIDNGYMTDAVKASVAWTATMAESDAFNPGVEEISIHCEIPSIRLIDEITNAEILMEISTPYRVTPVIYNTAGQMVQEYGVINPSSHAQQIRLDVSEIESGVYWVRIPGAPAEKLVVIR